MTIGRWTIPDHWLPLARRVRPLSFWMRVAREAEDRRIAKTNRRAIRELIREIEDTRE